MVNLLDSVDSLLADLNDCISELRQEEVNSLIHTNNKNDNSKYQPPLDDTLGSISSLPDAFGGWFQKATYNILKKRSLKKKYLILANSTLYVFSTDEHSKKFDDKFEINENSKARVSSKNPECCIEFETSFLGGASMFNEFEMILENFKKFEFECRDNEEMRVWLECFNEAIDEAVRGRVPLHREKNTQLFDPNSSRTSNTSHSSQNQDAVVSAAHQDALLGFLGAQSGSTNDIFKSQDSGLGFDQERKGSVGSNNWRKKSFSSGGVQKDTKSSHSSQNSTDFESSRPDSQPPSYEELKSQQNYQFAMQPQYYDTTAFKSIIKEEKKKQKIESQMNYLTQEFM